MKKVLKYILSTISIFALVSCSESDIQEDPMPGVPHDPTGVSYPIKDIAIEGDTIDNFNIQVFTDSKHEYLDGVKLCYVVKVNKLEGELTFTSEESDLIAAEIYNYDEGRKKSVARRDRYFDSLGNLYFFTPIIDYNFGWCDIKIDHNSVKCSFSETDEPTELEEPFILIGGGTEVIDWPYVASYTSWIYILPPGKDFNGEELNWY